MKNFGKMTAAPEPIILKGPQIGVNEDGSPVFAPDQQYNVLFFRNGDGVDIVDLAKTFPHPFYIAADASGVIISMTDDIEQSQIAGVDIIGIDSDFGFTYGPGGNVYGKNWDGAAIVSSEPEPEPIPDEISRRQFFQYLAVIGIISRAEALAAMQGGAIPAPLQSIIDQLPTEDDRFEAQMFVVGAQNFNRLHWLTDKVRQAMAWTLEQRDEFWRNAAKI
ncbi:hypothetical protein IR196_13735 [Brucella anthropi]|uniref:hypothetical protein n=1 Tax=Brucella anthropi TaxID=529 RepID=UPI00188A891A|nr:hypothetical protein [Brucella anthropi]QPA29264.1 hypothetical protein IR196_13735 [Brucella anthropi]